MNLRRAWSIWLHPSTCTVYRHLSTWIEVGFRRVHPCTDVVCGSCDQFCPVQLVSSGSFRDLPRWRLGYTKARYRRPICIVATVPASIVSETTFSCIYPCDMTPIILASKPRLDSGSEIGGPVVERHYGNTWILGMDRSLVPRLSCTGGTGLSSSWYPDGTGS
jgi:hypothetical protein